MTTPFAHIALIEDAAFVLADHAGYVWNKSQTRIRCSGSECALVMEVEEDPENRYADDIFATHQAEMLLAPIAGGELRKRVSAEGRQGTCRHCGKPIEVRSNQWTHALTSSGVCVSAATRFSPFPDMAAPLKAAA